MFFNDFTMENFVLIFEEPHVMGQKSVTASCSGDDEEILEIMAWTFQTVDGITSKYMVNE